MNIIILIVISLALLIVIVFIIKSAIKKDEREIYNTRCVILYNRRTRHIKEIFEKDYIEGVTWKEIVTIYFSMYDEFLKYLKNKRIMNNDGEYLGNASQGLFYLKSEFKKFLHESS